MKINSRFTLWEIIYFLSIRVSFNCFVLLYLKELRKKIGVKNAMSMALHEYIWFSYYFPTKVYN